jgi:sulfide:quinone oxidoreductase
MTTQASPSKKLRVIIVGGGVAGIETALALAHLAPEQTDVTLLAPNPEFVYRPMTVGEPFSYEGARHYSLPRIATDAGARLLVDELAWIDPAANTLETKAGRTIEYDALVLALGAHASPRYAHTTTIDDHRLDEVLHGLIQDVEGNYIHSLAFVSPGRMAWPMPLYELALMTAGRAYDMQIELSTTIVTPEDSPLAIFGSAASQAVGALLERAKVEIVTSAYAEVPSSGEVVINPGDRRLEVDRVIALPELYGPPVRGIPLGENGFIRVDSHGRVADVDGHVYAAGDAIDFPVKQGGLGAQQADAVAESIAALAGVSITPEPFHPVIHGMLLTYDKPLYMTAYITGGHGSSSQVGDDPTWSPPSKIAARYLAPYLEEIDGGKSVPTAASAQPDSPDHSDGSFQPATTSV